MTHAPRGYEEVSRDHTLRSVKERPSNVSRPVKPARQPSFKTSESITAPSNYTPVAAAEKPETLPQTESHNNSNSDMSSGSTQSTESRNQSPPASQPQNQSQSGLRGSQLPRPGSSYKPRPVSQKKRKGKPTPPPPPPGGQVPEGQENQTSGAPAAPAPQIRKGALGSRSKAQMKKNDPNSKSFLASSIFSMSFLLPKSNPNPPTTQPPSLPRTESVHNKSAVELVRTNSANKYPTNENSLARMASYAALPTPTAPGIISNSHLHPAAAGMNTKKLIRHSSVLQQSQLYKQMHSGTSSDTNSAPLIRFDEILILSRRKRKILVDSITNTEAYLILEVLQKKWISFELQILP